MHIIELHYAYIQEYERGESTEAAIVKDLDKFDMIFQAFEYEQGLLSTGSLAVVYQP